MSDQQPPMSEPPQPPPGQPGQPPQYGQPGQQPPPYGAPPPPAPYQQPGPVGGFQVATWGMRAIGTLWDFVYLWPGWVTVIVGYIILGVGAGGDSGALAGLGGLVVFVGFGLTLWRLIINYMLDQGRTGWTYGKRKVGIRTVNIADGQPSGVGSCVGRYFLHALINQACYLDYLWPLWDPMRQTLTDKILSTYVVKQPDPGA